MKAITKKRRNCLNKEQEKGFKIRCESIRPKRHVIKNQDFCPYLDLV